jgi:tRNA threonylcarbamoyladenosine biosynthesis protein TsaE
MEFITNSPQQTKKLGRQLAEKILRRRLKKKALVIGLLGDLGGGKTTFLQGFAKGLGIKEKITSPTFVIMKKFEIKKPNFRIFCHIDCYRTKKAAEISDLGFKEIISSSRNIVAVEWADKIKKILPDDVAILKFEFIDGKTRKIAINF